MKDIERLKKRLQDDSSFRNKFINVKDIDEALLLAENLGYKIKKEEIKNDAELNEDLMEAVSGGRKSSEKIEINNFAQGKGSSIHYE